MNSFAKNEKEVVVDYLEVQVYGSFEEAFKRFKSLVQKEKIVSNFKDRQSYEKPSEKKRRKAREAVERKLLTESRERLILSGEWDKRQKRKEVKRKQKQVENQQRKVHENKDV